MINTARRAVLDQLFSEESLRIALHGIHRLSDGSPVIGHEALMRGPRGAPYETPPMAFAMAATLDLLEELDCRCVAMAARVEAGGLLFINVHPRTLVSAEKFWPLVAQFGTVVQRRPQDVVFEVVEHSPARTNDLAHALTELRALGFRVAVDDLGEGAAGLRRLIEVVPDFAKIDRYFVDGIDRDRKRRAVVAALVRAAEELETTIIAEGVERADELAVLRDLGVPLAQGYLFGKPDEVHA